MTETRGSGPNSALSHGFVPFFTRSQWQVVGGAPRRLLRRILWITFCLVHRWPGSVSNRVNLPIIWYVIDIEALLANNGGVLPTRNHRLLKSSLCRWVKRAWTQLVRGCEDSECDVSGVNSRHVPR